MSSGASDDFLCRIIGFSQDVFMKAVSSLDTSFFNHIHDYPMYRHESENGRWREMELWTDMAAMLFSAKNHVSDEKMEVNFLQSLFPWMSKAVSKPVMERNGYGRRQSLCHKFFSLVHEYGAQNHDVAFYCNKLCISQRYLSEIINEYADGKSPKQIICEQAVAEIKVRLDNPSETVTSIADELNFCDGAGLSSFFKRHEGISPTEYRRRMLSHLRP